MELEMAQYTTSSLASVQKKKKNCQDNVIVMELHYQGDCESVSVKYLFWNLHKGQPVSVQLFQNLKPQLTMPEGSACPLYPPYESTMDSDQQPLIFTPEMC